MTKREEIEEALAKIPTEKHPDPKTQRMIEGNRANLEKMLSELPPEEELNPCAICHHSEIEEESK